MPEKPFGLSADEYWTDPQKNLQTLARMRVRDGVSGIVIDCPDRVTVSERQTLPLLSFYSGPTEELFAVPFNDYAVVTAIHPEEEVLYAAAATARTNVPKPAGGPAPSPGFTGQYNLVELRGTLGIPWRPGRYIATVLLREKVSNRVLVELSASRSSYDDPEVRKFLEEQRRKQPVRKIMPAVGDPLVRYGKVKGSLEAPEGVGLRLEADRVVVARREERGLLRGSFRLPVRITDVVRRLSQRHEKEGPLVTAVASISLLVAGSDDSFPWTIPMVVPSYDDVGGEMESPLATGHFQLDLLKIGRIATRPQTFFIYAFAGSEMAGPALMAVVSPDSLPGTR